MKSHMTLRKSPIQVADDNERNKILARGVVKSRQGEPTDGSADLALAERLEPGVFDEIRKLGVK